MKGKELPNVIILLIFIAARVGSRCISPSPLGLQFVMEYARWRSLDQLVIFDNLNPKKCERTYARSLLSCCGDKGLKISIQTSLNEHLADILPQALSIRKHRVGTVIFADGMNLTSPENILHLASQKQLFNYYISWLVVATKRNDAIIDTLLRVLNIGIDSDFIVATSPLSTSQALYTTIQYLNRTCPGLKRYAEKYKLPKISGTKKGENITMNLEYIIRENKTVTFYLSHVYKIRNSENSSLVVDPLGSWNPGSYALKLPVNVELRNNFHGFPLLVGILNSSSEAQSENIDEEEMNDILPLLDIMSFIVNGINARFVSHPQSIYNIFISIELVPHEKLGTMNNKAWSDLLGDVVSGAVDIGLGNINVNDARQRAMSFTHPIIQSMRNIYFHPPESGSMRDIFLQPFNNRLLGCVAATCIFIVLAMTAINYAAKLALSDETITNTGLGEAALWCISIMCMQGSPWCPKSPSGKIALLMSLIFALVIYNAYAGFITSILSVQAAGIKSLADLLLNNYKLGYSANDDEYIRNANDSNLRELYIKAYNGREGRLDTTSGLTKAANGGYGFFVSARLARRALRTTLVHNRCSLKELIIPQTFTVVALPMASTCPYKKIINHNVMRISEVGVLSRISERMLPRMPQCEALTTFHSARLADVYSAFVILVTGVISALTLGIFERVWSQRKSIRGKFKQAIQIHNRRVEGQSQVQRAEKKFNTFIAPSGFSRESTPRAADNDSSLRRHFISNEVIRSPKSVSGDVRETIDHSHRINKPNVFSGIKLFSPNRIRESRNINDFSANTFNENHNDLHSPGDNNNDHDNDEQVFPFYD